jgi:hypothetical protein
MPRFFSSFHDISKTDVWVRQKAIQKEGEWKRPPETVAELSDQLFGTFGIEIKEVDLRNTL